MLLIIWDRVICLLGKICILEKSVQGLSTIVRLHCSMVDTVPVSSCPPCGIDTVECVVMEVLWPVPSSEVVDTGMMDTTV